MVQIESLYLHFPYCRHLCNYCDFYKNLIGKDQDFTNFHQYLETSWTKHKQLLNENHFELNKLKTLYIGGGTPSLWSVEGASFLEDYFESKKISFDENIEFTLEVNPGSWTHESLMAWRSFGANRFSLGVQTLNPNVIKFLDRVHTIDDVYSTLDYFSEYNLNFSVDFMLGLPQSLDLKRDIISELEEICDKYDPNHFSLYILTVNDKYKHFDLLPEDEFVEQEYLSVASYLKERGFEHYEVSNFSKKNFFSRHNFAYWNGSSVAALGPSASGYLANGKRYKWKPAEVNYTLEILNEKQQNLEKLYLSLRTNQGLDLTSLNLSEGEQENLSRILKKWENADQASLYENRVILTSKGFLVMDSLLDELFNLENIT